MVSKLLTFRFLIPAIVITLVLMVLTLFIYKDKGSNANSQAEVNSVNSGQPSETQRIIEEVGKLMELPQGEIPRLATITDVEQLKDQPLFANARNGDKVLIYTQAGKAILYDPTNKRILNVLPIVASQSGSVVTPSEDATTSADEAVN